MHAQLRGWSLCLAWSATAAIATGAAGCEQAATATRTWQPSDHGQPADAPQDGRAAPEPPAEGGQARAARALYQVSCAGCHGQDGRGGGDQLPPGAKPPNFADAAFMASRSDAALAEVITEGRGLMPAFADKLSPTGIQALVTHLRSFTATRAATAATDGAARPSPTPTADAGQPE